MPDRVQALGLFLGFLAALAVGPGLAELIHHSGFNPFMAIPDGPGCDPTGSAACGVFVRASHPYRGAAQ